MAEPTERRRRASPGHSERLLAIAILGVIALSVVVGGILLIWKDSKRTVPSELIAIGSASVGAIVGLLAGARRDELA